MSNNKRQNQIDYATRQFEIHKMYAFYAQAEALTGAYKQRDRSRGREPTEEERAQGLTMGHRQLTDEEKLKTTLDTMHRHIHIMSECNDTIASLQSEDEQDR